MITTQPHYQLCYTSILNEIDIGTALLSSTISFTYFIAGCQYYLRGVLSHLVRAKRGIRTLTPVTAPDFESGVSASSTILTWYNVVDGNRTHARFLSISSRITRFPTHSSSRICPCLGLVPFGASGTCDCNQPPFYCALSIMSYNHIFIQYTCTES